MSIRPSRPNVGDKPVFFVDVTDDDGDAVDPTAGRLLIARPSATVSEVIPFNAFTIAPDGVTGRVEYSPDPLDEGGLWRIYWEFTGGVEAAEPYEFSVLARTVPDPA